jgi:hypothetical protein
MRRLHESGRRAARLPDRADLLVVERLANPLVDEILRVHRQRDS